MDFTTLDDYNNGFLGGEQEGAAELLKAMQAGQITGEQTLDQALTIEPLKAESLEKTLKLLDFRTQDIRLVNKLPKMTAYNTVEEFLQLKSYGTDRGGFYNEGELSDVEDSVYVRRSELVKYVQVTGEVTMQAQMVRTNFVDAYRKEVENKTMWILRRVNEALTKGDADVIGQQFNSLYKQHANIGSGGGLDFLYPNLESYFTSPVVIDMRGNSVTQFEIEQAAVQVDLGFGTPTDFFAPTTINSALMQDFFKVQRIMLESGSPGAYMGAVGTVVPRINTSIGPINLNGDKFMAANPPRFLTDPGTSAKSPAAPVYSSIGLTASTIAKWVAGDAGAAYYAVAAVNRYGESQLTPMGASAVTITVGDAVDMVFTAGAGANAATGYVIYRTKITTAGSNAGLLFYPVFQISTADLAGGYDGGGAGHVFDEGRFLPGMEQAFLAEVNDTVMSLKQLAPISKLDLAIISMSRRFIAFNFCTPNLYAPKKMVRFINCAPTLNARSGE